MTFEGSTNPITLFENLYKRCTLGLDSCISYATNLPAFDVGLIIVIIFVSLFIILRLFHFIVGDSEIF